MNDAAKSGASAGGSGALVTILEWWSYRHGYELTAPVAIALTAILAPLLQFVATLFGALSSMILAKITGNIQPTPQS